MSKKRISIFFLIISFLILGVLYISQSKEDIVLKDYKNNSDKYLLELENKFLNLDPPMKITSNELIKKLKIIDQMYTDGLINASQNTYYLPSDCGKDSCFSVRETYLFNFNFPLYEG